MEQRGRPFEGERSDAAPAAQAYARVWVDLAVEEVDEGYDYAVPKELAGRVQPGSWVEVPFGRRRLPGIVLELLDRPAVEPVRPILRLLSGEVVLTRELTGLVTWLAEAYAGSRGQAMRLVLPPGLRQGQDGDTGPKRLIWRLREGAGAVERLPAGASAQRRVAEALAAAGPSGVEAASAAELARKLSAAPAAVRALAAKGWIEAAVAETAIAEAATERGGASRSTGASGFGAAASGQASLTDAGRPGPPVGRRRRLTPHQEQALAAIRKALAARRHETFLLHGVTGSGKTEVYLRAMADALADGRSALLLLPEIALAPQTAARVQERFGAGVAVLHSGLTDAERRRAWWELRRGRARAVVGARSAVFAPLSNLGLIIIDEEHEPAYKQEDQLRYDAREVAAKRARDAGAVLVLGSATPRIETFAAARRGDIVPLRLPERAGAGRPPEVSVVDMRAELRAGNRRMFSRALTDALSAALARGGQAVLFLNRRGRASFVLCRECGSAITCPHCDVSLTLHGAQRLACHYCGHQQRLPSACPACGSRYIRDFGTGTERVEELVRSLFPDDPVIRLDADTAARRGAHERAYRAFLKGEAWILVGTQMIAKGWDVPSVTLVGVVAADTTLHLPDFRAAERTYQLLEQVAGRAGRGEQPGRVVIQTYLPEHPAIQAVAGGGADRFYREELAWRREIGYPPFRQMVRLLLRSRRQDQVEAAAAALRTALAEAGELHSGVEAVGPGPAPLGRLRGETRWQVLLFAAEWEPARRLALYLRRRLQAAALDVRTAVDVAPASLL